MSFLSLSVLAVGVAMDAAAVSASCGLVTPVLRLRHYVMVALFFGGFQALMPLLGFLLGSQIGDVVSTWDHWIAFVVLGGLGLHMIHQARAGGGDELRAGRDVFELRMMTMLAIATSIDAFAVGVTLPMLEAPLTLSLIMIGVTTAALSALGLWIGRRFGARVGRRMDAIGGVLLVLFGVKILIEHLS